MSTRSRPLAGSTELFDLADRLVDAICAADPIRATYVGVEGWNDQWGDRSPAGHAAMAALWAELKRALENIGFDKSDPNSVLAYRVMDEEASRELAAYERGDHHFDMNNLASPFQYIREAFDLQPAATELDWEHLLERLETIGQAMGDYQACLEEGRSLGRMVAKRQVRAVIEQARSLGGEDSGLHHLRTRLVEADLPEPTRVEIVARLEAALSGAREVYRDFANYLEATYLPDAVEQDPVGRQRYAAAVDRFLGTELDLEETYRWGWEEVERLSALAADICQQIRPGASLADTLQMLNHDAEGDAGSPEAFVQVIKQRQQLALNQLAGEHFDVPEPVRDIEVMVAPPGGAAGAYYTPPAEDYSRPGTVWYSLEGRESYPLYGEISTAYHEGFPGHHLQVGIQMERADQLSRFHRLMVWYPGAGEGWALYAEHLMGELGYLEKPEYELGLVIQQLFRACRVVIDIGTHCGFPIPDDVSFHPGASWTFDLAVELLTERTGEPQGVVESEITRYFGWPGQAISYKVGERAILELREELSARPDFDLKAFHTKVLSIGSLGLDLTREFVLA